MLWPRDYATATRPVVSAAWVFRSTASAQAAASPHADAVGKDWVHRSARHLESDHPTGLMGLRGVTDDAT